MKGFGLLMFVPLLPVHTAAIELVDRSSSLSVVGLRIERKHAESLMKREIMGRTAPVSETLDNAVSTARYNLECARCH